MEPIQQCPAALIRQRPEDCIHAHKGNMQPFGCLSRLVEAMDHATVLRYAHDGCGTSLITGEVALSPLTLDPSGTLRRESPRPWYLRQPGYDQEFDWHTIFYEVFWTADGAVMLLGPSLRNLESAVRSATQNAFGLRRCAVAIRTLSRNSQITVSSNLPAVSFGGLTVQPRVPVQPNCCAWFRGKRVIFTVSKDNELQWIRDWATFYVRKHGCDAVLIYDNGSTRYGTGDIPRALSGIAGLDIVAVVPCASNMGRQAGRDGNGTPTSASTARSNMRGTGFSLWPKRVSTPTSTNW